MFKRKKIEKETNIALTPENEDIRPTKTKFKVIFFLWNIFSITLYSCYTLFLTYRLAEKTFLSKIIVYLLALYSLAFLLLVLINIGNRKKLKSKLKNYKSATKFFKYAMQILNFVLSIITAVSALISTGKADLPTIAFAILSIFITLIMIFVEIISIIIRKNIPIIKQNFLDIREKPRKSTYNNDK